ncbi:hypothetical protein [Poseidonibacter lekithochrous]|uniref:hypothetical protein n=1 Tax=Poseidonibacter lekithochrous TaxID=1904463 RepID=UPI000D39CD49|nr:hypothetical protein [Poseidonibacter lekithochrous]
MQTKKYKSDIEDILNSKFSTYVAHDYDFFSYEENGIPKKKLIFLKYRDFDDVVNIFFDELNNYLNDTGLFENIKTNVEYKSCIVNFFKKSSLTDGSISKKHKEKYNDIKNINEHEFNILIQKISIIKIHYKKKYIPLYEKIRNEQGKKLILENNIHICPYCKRNYINVVTSDKDKSFVIKPDLDHFYDKASYIFFAGTVENLVPSCTVCNSKLKGTKDFAISKHIHPLVDSDIFKKIKFNYIGSNNTIYIENKNELSIMEQQTIETFRIEEIYNTHKEILFNIKNKHYHYNITKRNTIQTTLPNLNSQKILETIFYEYFHLDELKEPMYKMKRDLFNNILKKDLYGK